jgi:lipopolysaccharide/colanic/teichoic acid biosynthesis glycosyltransferase
LAEILLGKNTKVLLQEMINAWHSHRVIVHDLIAAGVSFPIAMLLRLSDDPERMREALPTLSYGVPLFLACCAVTFSLFGMHRAFWRYATAQELLVLFKATACAIVMFVAALFIVDRLVTVPRAVPVIMWFVLVGLLCGSRLTYVTVVVPSRRARALGVSHDEWEPVVVAGVGDATALLIQLTTGRRPGEQRFGVVGLLDSQPGALGRSVHHVPVMGRLDDLPQAVAQLSVHGMRPRRVVLGLPLEQYDAGLLEQLYASAEQLAIPVHTADKFVRLTMIERERESRAENAQITTQQQTVFLTLKRLTDVAGALLLLLVTAPLMLVPVLSLWGSLGRPVFFHQVRPGRNLQPFTLYKFRTLKHGHILNGRMLSDEERQTFLGNLIRRTRLDELPQLWNVLIGDMSLIGPRPLLPRDLPDLGEALHERFSVRPGLTGWAQVNGGHQLTTDQKLALDLWYIHNHSLWLDLKILGKTIWMVIFGERVNEAALRQARGLPHQSTAGVAPTAAESVAVAGATRGG